MDMPKLSRTLRPQMSVHQDLVLRMIPKMNRRSLKAHSARIGEYGSDSILTGTRLPIAPASNLFSYTKICGDRVGIII